MSLSHLFLRNNTPPRLTAVKNKFMKKTIIKFLLFILNSEWLNNTPCKYAFVGNLDNFSTESLESEVRQNPHVMVREILYQAKMFKNCPCNSVIEDGVVRDMTSEDIEDIKNLTKLP